MSNRQASKLESTIQIRLTRARKSAECYSCGRAINPGDDYDRQSLGLIRKPPRVRLNAFCLDCRYSPLAKKLDTGQPCKGNNSAANRPSLAKFSVASNGCHDVGVNTQPPLFSWEELEDK